MRPHNLRITTIPPNGGWSLQNDSSKINYFSGSSVILFGSSLVYFHPIQGYATPKSFKTSGGNYVIHYLSL